MEEKMLIKRILFLVLIICILMLASCASFTKKSYMKDTASFNPEPNGMWTRPTEIGYEIIGDVEGEAEVMRVMGFVASGEAPSAKITESGTTNIMFFPLLTIRRKFDKSRLTPLERFAAYNAMKSVNADGIYITMAVTEKRGFLPFYSYRKAYVRGKALRIVDLGIVDQERVDKYRYLKILPQDVFAPIGVSESQNVIPTLE
jgi:hypothetical protein